MEVIQAMADGATKEITIPVQMMTKENIDHFDEWVAVMRKILEV